jgi:hypothetical protein
MEADSMTDPNKQQDAPAGTGAPSRNGITHKQNDYTALEWFSKQGARFVRVAAWNAKVNAPGKQPIESGWQNKPLTLKDVLPHVKSGGNVGLLCGKHSGGLCLLDVDERLQEFLEYFPGLKDAPIIQRRDAPGRGKIVLKFTGVVPKNKKWNGVHLEFLSTGNQGVIPPSVHPTGTSYELFNGNNPPLAYDAERLIRVCDAWADIQTEADIESPAVTTPIATDNGRGKPARQTKDFLEFGAGPHTRNNRLFNAACDLNGCGYSQAEAEWMLLPVWARMSKTDKEAKATIASAYKQPRTPANPRAFDAGSAKALKTAPVVVIENEDAEERSESLPLHSTLPALPKIAHLTDAEIKQGRKTGKFIDDYVKFATKDAPMSPPLFHLTYALAILSTAIARRVYVSAGTNAIYPNLYILLSAPSTLYTKTTGYKSAMKVLELAGLSHLLLPNGVTPQSLITELSNRPQENFQSWTQDDKDEWQKERMFAGQRAWWIDEAARLLAQFQQKHLAELQPIILELYDCAPKIKISTQVRGRETVRNAYLTICGPTTPAALRPHLKTPDYWTNGLFARFLFVSPDTAPIRVFYPDPFPVPPQLAKHVNKLAFERLESPKESALGQVAAPPAIEAKIAPKAKRHFNNYHAAMFELNKTKAIPEKLESCYGRMHEKAIKIAMLLAASDWAGMAKGNPLVIQDIHWFRAQEITEGYRASLHRMIEEASAPVENDDDELAQKIIAKLRIHPNRSLPELARDFHMSTGVKYMTLKQIIFDLVETKMIETSERQGKRGSPATVYKVCSE